MPSTFKRGRPPAILRPKVSRTRREPRSTSKAEERLRGLLEEFLAMLGHELRNRLGAIRTALQVIDHAGASPEEPARQRAIIERQMRHLAHLVDDLLDVSRVLSGRIELDARRIHLHEIARQSLPALRGDTRMQARRLALGPGRAGRGVG